MSWDKPGGNRPNGPHQGDGPPDLDELLKKVRDMFGRSGKSRSSRSTEEPPHGKRSMGVAAIIVVLALLGYIVYDSVFVIEQAERGVVTRFGAYNRTDTGGLNFKFPWPIEEVTQINVDRNNMISVPQQTVLTSDENMVIVDLTVQYNIKNAEDFLFEVRNPASSLREMTESALREVIGKNEMDFVIKDGRSAIAEQTLSLLQETIDLYQTGILVTSVNLESAQPPAPVQDAFSDAIRAREDKERRINEAEAYANGIIPRARGQATQIQEEAKAYRTRVTRLAEGETDRFNQIYEQYSAAPDITRERLYIENIENVLEGTNKVLVGTDSSAPISYLPLDRLVGERKVKAPTIETSSDYDELRTQPEPAASLSSDTSGSFDTRSRLRGN